MRQPLSQDAQVTAQVEDIGPKEADAYLANNKINRPIYTHHVIYLARQMTQGMWHLTGQPLILDKDDNILNGQHCLLAIIRSGTTQKFLVVRGIAKEAFHVMDAGKKRSYKDALYVEGFPQQALYGGLAKKLIMWKKGIYFGGSKFNALKPTNDEIVTYCINNRKKLAESINYLLQANERLKENKIIPGGLLVFFYHLFKESNQAQSFDFCERLVSGYDTSNVPKYQPIDKVRKRLIQNKADDAKLSQKLITLMGVGAWNAYRASKKLHQLNGLADIPKYQGKIIKIN